MMALADSCKKTVQIFELLEERNLSFAFGVKKDELLVLSGIGLLYQSIDLDINSKMFKDNQAQVTALTGFLSRTNAPCLAKFTNVARSFLPLRNTDDNKHPPVSRHNSDGAMPAPQFYNLSPPEKNKLKAASQRLMVKSPFDHHKDFQRRATFPNIAIHQEALQTQSQPNLGTPFSPAQMHLPRSEPARSPDEDTTINPVLSRQSLAPPLKPTQSFQQRKFNLDYLSFSNGPTRSHSPDLSGTTNSGPQIKTEHSDWELLLGSIDNGQSNIFDNIYGGTHVEFLKDTTHLVHHGNAAPSVADSLSWNSPQMWNLSGPDGANVCTSAPSATHAESVFSMGTDDGAVSGEEFFGNDWNSGSSTNGSEAYAGIVMPDMGNSDDGLLGSLWNTTAV